MSGAGNDFVVIDNRKKIITDAKDLAPQLCDRRFGIGADGLLLLEDSHTASFAMKYYNADGSYGGMCGNGGRCISKFAFVSGIVQQPSFTFEALEHAYNSTILPSGDVVLQMTDPVDIQMKKQLTAGSTVLPFHQINTGSPHCIILWEEAGTALGPSFSSIFVNELGRQIRHHEMFLPDGTNVNFIKRLEANSIQIRTYERGVESETLACGTGSIGSAIIAATLYSMRPPIEVLVQSGEKLVVDFATLKNKIGNVTLLGSAHIVYKGTIILNEDSQRITYELNH